MRLLMVTGGTGGHVLPSLQMAERLISSCAGLEIEFAGHGLTKNRFFTSRFPATDIESAPLSSGWRNCKGALQAFSLFKRFDPDVVIGFGSYHTIAPLLVAVLQRRRLFLYAPDCRLGKANALFAPFAEKLLLQHPLTKEKKKGIFLELYPWIKGAKGEDKPLFAEKKWTLLVMGGSQGALFFNRELLDGLEKLKEKAAFQVIHLTGSEEMRQEVEKRYLAMGIQAIVKGFEREMGPLYQAADLVIGRAGAATVGELLHYEKSALLIPYPFAGNHQEENGAYLSRCKGAILLCQSASTSDLICQLLLQAKEERGTMEAALKKEKESRVRVAIEDLL